MFERLDPEPGPLKAARVDLDPEIVALDAEPVSIEPTGGGAQAVAGRTARAVADAGAELTRAPIRVTTRRRTRELSVTRQDVLALVAVYLGVRGVLLLAAYLLSSFGHHNFLHELANWDGLWYREVANHGYLDYPSLKQTTLGFFPLFPVTIWVLEPLFSVTTGHDAIWASTVAGAVISATGGAIATYYVYRLACDWWDRQIAFKAALLFILFPGSVVFSMVYSEGLLLPLAAACMFYLGRKRWLLAGVLAGCATAVQPVAVALIVVCAVAAFQEWRRSGWQMGVARRVIVAPILSVTGLAAFAIFLWLWTGTPLANYQAQHHGWSEKTNPFALIHLTKTLWLEINHQIPHLPHAPINLNLVVGLIGAILLVPMWVMLYRQRRRIPGPVFAWTGVVTFLAVTSQYVPPNPRMLITAFPALMVAAVYVRGKWWASLLWTNAVVLVVLSLFTFYGETLRP